MYIAGIGWGGGGGGPHPPPPPKPLPPPPPPLMAAAAAKNQDPTTQPSTSPYAQAICRVAVAQICLNAGYSGAEAAALRVLTDIAGRYIKLLGCNAASAANSRGRTQPNIFDVVIALESAAASRGYAGASQVTRPLLRSAMLHELRAFMAAIDEIPFPLPIRRRTAIDEERKPIPSFAQVGKEPPMPHVPRWLPCFPDGWEKEGERDSSKVAEKKQQMPAVEAGAEMQSSHRVVLRSVRIVLKVLREHRLKNA
ncbi:transcription initiation factor TFIID subunit 8-like [Phalaenopsis equestris]|uniref:transcription initiation factor TFIID subunit 8-like n=1 Tax=Phalaenopsis equestris TaxID=78828 RepID=UPI0009E64955|nr:transcription initiation factor TFIID subunit 8-like [Phalaenopsis equestris]